MSKYETYEDYEAYELKEEIKAEFEIPEKYENLIIADTIILSSDEKHIAYVVKEKGEGGNFVVIDNEEERNYEDVRNLIFSPDSKRLAYIAGDGGKEFVVDIIVGATEEEEKRKTYNHIKSLFFSPDSQHLVYIATEGGEEFVVKDEEEGGKHKEIIDIACSSIKERDLKITYTAKGKEGKKRIVINGTEGEQHDDVRNPVYSPDSKYLAYIVKDKKDEFVVVNSEIGNEEGKKYDRIWGLFYSTDKQCFSYMAENITEKKHEVFYIYCKKLN